MKAYHIYIGVIPGIFGYGISVASDSKEGAMTALRSAYDRWKEARPDSHTNFDSTFESFGGSVIKVELGKAYHNGFNS